MDDSSRAIIKELEELKGQYLSQVSEEHFSKGNPHSYTLKEIRYTTHKIAGSAPSYGLVSLGEFARKVEDECLAGEEDRVRDLWRKFLERFEEEKSHES